MEAKSNSSSSKISEVDEGLKALCVKNGLEEESSLSLFKMVDPIRELGLDLEQKQYSTRLEALSNPAAYARKRQETFDEMVKHIRTSY